MQLPIDKIARQRGEDVLFLEFLTINQEQTFEDFAQFKHRDATITWLYDMGIPFEECLPMGDGENWKGGYLGHVYFPSVRMSEDDGMFKAMQEHFEKADGTPRIKGVIFYYLPLADANKNSHVDPIPNKMKRRGMRVMKGSDE